MQTVRRRRRPSGGPMPPLPAVAAAMAAALLASSVMHRAHAGAFSAPLAFVGSDCRPSCNPRSRLSHRSALRMSSIGGGNLPPDDGDNLGGSDDDNPLNNWMNQRDTENLRRVREQFAEGRLPISYGAMNADGDARANGKNATAAKNGSRFGPLQNATQSAATDGAIDAASTPDPGSSLSRPKSNPYLHVVSRLAPSDLIARFTASASPRVQDAVRTTVLGLIGGLPQMAFETKTVATGERLASLMFQLQMTGYMFKNAEYRLSLSQSLGRSDRMLPGGVAEDGAIDGRALSEGKLKGKIKVRYGGGGGSASDSKSNESSEESDDATKDGEAETKATSSASSPGLEVEVDAQAYMSELRGEVSRLRDELDATKQAKEEEIRKDLLMYIRTLPQQELQQLTGTMSPEVLEAMKGLVTAVLAGIGEDEDEEQGVGDAAGTEGNVNKIGPETVTEQSGEALAQLCMWQLVVGFNLRELEVREEFRASMTNMLGDGGSAADDDGQEGSDGGGVQFGPGALE